MWIILCCVLYYLQNFFSWTQNNFIFCVLELKIAVYISSSGDIIQGKSSFVNHILAKVWLQLQGIKHILNQGQEEFTLFSWRVSTLIVVLVCYCCLKKYLKDALVTSQIFNIEKADIFSKYTHQIYVFGEDLKTNLKAPTIKNAKPFTLVRQFG